MPAPWALRDPIDMASKGRPASELALRRPFAGCHAGCLVTHSRSINRFAVHSGGSLCWVSVLNRGAADPALRPARPDPAGRPYGALAAAPLLVTFRDRLRRGSFLACRAVRVVAMRTR